MTAASISYHVTLSTGAQCVFVVSFPSYEQVDAVIGARHTLCDLSFDEEEDEDVYNPIMRAILESLLRKCKISSLIPFLCTEDPLIEAMMEGATYTKIEHGGRALDVHNTLVAVRNMPRDLDDLCLKSL